MRYILLITTTLLLAACGNNKKQAPAEETVTTGSVTLNKEQLANAGISTGVAEQRAISSVIKVTGKIDVPPQNMVSVSFPLGGYLKSTKLLSGMHVRKGEVIATMEDQAYIQLQQDYLTARARQQYLENEYQRQRELNQSKASSDKVFQQAEAEYKSNKITISSLGQKLQLIGINPDRLHEGSISRSVNIYSPIDGFVSKVNVNIGKYVNPADVLFELVNPQDIHLALTVFEKDISKLAIGQKLVAYTNNSDKKYPCEIILIGQDVSPERNIEVHCHFEQYDKTLVPGMYMNADIETHNRQWPVVPEDAVVNYEGKQYIFAAYSGNRYELKEVTTGDTENGFIALTSAKGIDLRTQPVVMSHAYTLLMKLKNRSE